MMRRRIAAGMMVMIFVTAGWGREDAREEPAGFGSLHKSLLVPGWGQLAEKHYLEGLGFLAAEIFCLTGVLVNNTKGNDAYRLYQEADGIDSAAQHRKLTEKYDIRRNQFILAAAAVWAVNLIDIYVIVRGKVRKARNFDLNFESGSNKDLAVSLSYRF